MKKIIIFSLSLASLLAGCDVESPMDKDLYPQKVYIVGARDKIIDRDIDLGNSPDTIDVSVAVSGSLPLNQNVTVFVAEDSTAIKNYNIRNLSAEAVQYQKPDDAIYSYSSDHLTINAGNVYNTYPVYIDPVTLHCDSLYMLPLRLTSTSAYELNDDSVALVRFNLVNKYSGLYYVKGVLKNTTDPKAYTVYQMARNLVATDNGSTVRMYHYNIETKDYRPSYAFKITVNETDTTLTYSTWDQFVIYDGGGVYYPTLKLYDFWYEYDNNGTRWRAEGYLYKERKTAAEQQILNDWLEEHSKN